MCGLTAIFSYGGARRPVDEGELARIDAHMVKRGPDGDGKWMAGDGLTGLAHRRLAIIDPGPSGAQPMAFQGNHITFNGEIYNFRDLRQQLIAQGRSLKTNSDTEVLLHLYDRDGPDMLNRLRGMFAFAIWDEARQGLFMARDPYGIKPLYYADDGKTLRVASQVKALRAGGAISNTPNPAGHVGFFTLGYVPEPHTIFADIKALPAGNSLWLDKNGKRTANAYFDVSGVFANLLTNEQKPDQLREALTDSMRHHLVADVPVGIFLSAGLDSATIAALASEVSGVSLDTMTLRFDELSGTNLDEAPLAEEIARHYTTRHQTRTVFGKDFHDDMAGVFSAMDQPTVDGVNTYFVAKEASSMGLKVALSGLGGDELFGGYESFRQIPSLVSKLGWIPGIRLFGKGFRVVTAAMADKFTSPKYAGVFEYGASFGAAYLLRRGLFMPWELPKVLDVDLARQGWRELDLLTRLETTVTGVDHAKSKVSALESVWYMRNQLLRDADWAGMAHSLEIRTPLVDVNLLTSVASLLASKQQMARTPEKPLPDAILNRPKTGFYIPVREWLMGDGEDGGERGLRGWSRMVFDQALI